MVVLVVVLVALQEVDDSRARAARLSRAAGGRAPSPPRRHGRLGLRPSRRVPRRLLGGAAPRRHREVVVVALAVARQPALLLCRLGLGRDARSLWRRRRRLALGRLVRVRCEGQWSGSGSGVKIWSESGSVPKVRMRARAGARVSGQGQGWACLGCLRGRQQRGVERARQRRQVEVVRGGGRSALQHGREARADVQVGEHL